MKQIKMTQKHTILLCDECMGGGYKIDNEMGHLVTTDIKCDICNGTGRLVETVVTKIIPFNEHIFRD